VVETWRRTGRERPPRVLALLAFRDEMRFLPGYFRNVPSQVDGIVALDDGSTDESRQFVERQPGVLELVRKLPQAPHVWDEPENRRLLIDAAGRHHADWLVAVDADERLERGFRDRAGAEIARAEAAGIEALSVHFRELWDAPDTYRADGVWGKKRFARFFRYRADAVIDPRALHGHWAPLNSKTGGGFPAGDLYVYHLRMLNPAWRRARRERYEWLDPDRRYQEIGYEYLTDEAGLRLERLPAGREYEPLGIG
jgi:hypothetical protein